MPRLPSDGHVPPAIHQGPPQPPATTPRAPRRGTTTLPAPPDSALRRTPRTGTNSAPTPPGLAMRRTLRFSPYHRVARRSSTGGQSSQVSPGEQSVQTPASTPAQSPSRPRRSPGSARQLLPSPTKIGRPSDPIWQYYFVERENGKRHGRCIYCGALKRTASQAETC
ncbi:hypothetical protein ON010_g8820 [Phytophthora cinnamomi]|nr:hypothetical protein ON010_g8820 [Phytophthora cinnamomi]